MARLYGISNSNRTGDDLWGKNQFNSSFPASLLCYMGDNFIKPVYVNVDQQKVVNTEIDIVDLFNLSKPETGLYFDFESTYPPYNHLCYDNLGKIDLVIRECDIDGNPGRYLRPLEVKLTVIPDNTTYKRDESDWSSELVIRPASTSWATLGILNSCQPHWPEIRKIFEPVGSTVHSWNNKSEILSIRKDLLKGLSNFYQNFHHLQQPFLVQPIWKTEGKSPTLSEDCFDVFVWSDFALCKTFIDRANEGSELVVSRYLRSAARMFRVIYEVSRVGKVNIESIYSQMTFNLQTDKEFALSGMNTLPYLPTTRREHPIMNQGVLKQIVLDDGYRKLSPERRFDASIFFASEKLFGK